MRATRTGRFYQPAKYKKEALRIRSEIIQQLSTEFAVFEKEVVVEELVLCYPPLKSFNKKTLKKLEEGGTEMKTTKPDIDNMLKPLFDCLNGFVWADDAKVHTIKSITKAYCHEPYTKITISGI